jgi:hypothetical protein
MAIDHEEPLMRRKENCEGSSNGCSSSHKHGCLLRTQAEQEQLALSQKFHCKESHAWIPTHVHTSHASAADRHTRTATRQSRRIRSGSGRYQPAHGARTIVIIELRLNEIRQQSAGLGALQQLRQQTARADVKFRSVLLEICLK